MIKREGPAARRSKHLCLDAGYPGQPALEIILRHDYIPHVASRTQEKKTKQLYPGREARHKIVEVRHSWFNRFRKLLVRYEKLERSSLALNHLAAGIIALRKVHLKINIIYGSMLRRRKIRISTIFEKPGLHLANGCWSWGGVQPAARHRVLEPNAARRECKPNSTPPERNPK